MIVTDTVSDNDWPTEILTALSAQNRLHDAFEKYAAV